MFCAPRPVLGGIAGAGSRSHVLRSRTHFRQNRRRRVRFSCFALPTLFGAVPRAQGLIFMFYAPGLVFGSTEGAGSHFLVLRSRTSFRRYRGCRVLFLVLRRRTRFRRYRGRQVPFACSTLSNSFLAGPRAPGPGFIFFAPEPILADPDGVGCCFHVLRS
jgi:hypothetical protein